jgi:hypothetical protein
VIKTSTIVGKLEKFGPGPWQAEPDRIEWKHAGFVCLVTRNEINGHFCGYVGVPPGHPWHGVDDSELRADVHGGCTYAEHCQDHVCHVPEPGEPEHLYWLGFDCHHHGDLTPRDVLRGDVHGSYRDEAYVLDQTESLARQAAAACGKAAE